MKKRRVTPGDISGEDLRGVDPQAIEGDPLTLGEIEMFKLFGRPEEASRLHPRP